MEVVGLAITGIAIDSQAEIGTAVGVAGSSHGRHSRCSQDLSPHSIRYATYRSSWRGYGGRDVHPRWGKNLPSFSSLPYHPLAGGGDELC